MGRVQGGARAAFATPSWGPARISSFFYSTKPFVTIISFGATPHLYYFCYMISEKDLTNSQNIPYEERIARIEKMIESEEEPKAFELGLLLALKMGQEIREKKPLGSTTGEIVAAWSSKYSESVVEEAIAHAKQFLTNPGALVEKMKNIMLKKMNKPEDESDHNETDEAQGGK